MTTMLRNIRISELSLVKRGANPGAKVVLIKRDFTQAERDKASATGAAMPDGSFPIHTTGDLKNAIRLAGNAKNPAAARAHIKTRAASLGASDMIPDTWKKSLAFEPDSVPPLAMVLERALCAIVKQEIDGDAEPLSSFAEELDEQEGEEELRNVLNVLSRAVYDIACNEDASTDDKATAIAESVGQFLSTLRDRFPDADVQLAKLLKANAATAVFMTNASIERGDPMNEAERKEMDALKKTATESADALKKAMTAIDELKKASMSDAHSAFMAQMPEQKRSSFASMTADERDAHMKANPIKKTAADLLTELIANVSVKQAGPEILTIGTSTINKADLPAGVFEVIKGLHATVSVQAEQIAKADEARAEAELIQKVKADYPHLPGEPLKKAQMLRALGKVNADVRETVEKIMAAANKAVGDRLSELGGGGERQVVGTAEQRLNELAKEYAENHKVSFAKAYDHVLVSNPKMYQEYIEEKRTAVRAAG